VKGLFGAGDSWPCHRATEVTVGGFECKAIVTSGLETRKVKRTRIGSEGSRENLILVSFNAVAFEKF
jgi:hypothetical protein